MKRSPSYYIVVDGVIVDRWTDSTSASVNDMKEQLKGRAEAKYAGQLVELCPVIYDVKTPKPSAIENDYDYRLRKGEY